MLKERLPQHCDDKNLTLRTKAARKELEEIFGRERWQMIAKLVIIGKNVGRNSEYKKTFYCWSPLPKL